MKKKSVDIFKFLSVLLVFIFILFIPQIIQKQIKITKIECESQHGLCPEELNNDLNNYIGFDLRRTKSNINGYLNQNVLINDFLIQYKIPNTLKVEINVKKPKTAIYVKENNSYYLIDKDGLTVDVSNESNLPKIEVSNIDLKPGEIIENKELFALNIVENLSFLYAINSGIIENNTLRVKSNEGITILFPLEGDTQVLIGSIRLIFSRLNDGSEGIRMEDVREIDLRFKNPVIR